ncbi:hypothetical protein SALBM311S_12501 [Streptomyces alboniger]
MVASTCGSIAAAEAPCATRAATRDQASGASPQASEVKPEGRHAAQEQAAPAEEVAEPAAQDQQDGVRHPVSGDDQFQDRLARGQVRADGGQGDVDDEEVDEREGRGQQHGEEAEAAERGRRRGCRTRTGREVMVSVTWSSLRPFPGWYQSLLVLVVEVPGNRVRGAAPWRHDDHDGPGDGAAVPAPGHRLGDPAARTRRLPAQPPRAHRPRAGRAAPRTAPPHTGAAARGGRPALGRRRHLVHLAGAGPGHPPSPCRCSTHSPARCSTHTPVSGEDYVNLVAFAPAGADSVESWTATPRRSRNCSTSSPAGIPAWWS